MGVVPCGDTLKSVQDRVNYASLYISPQFILIRCKGISQYLSLRLQVKTHTQTPPIFPFLGMLNNYPKVPNALNSCCRALGVFAASQVFSTSGDQALHCQRVCGVPLPPPHFVADNCLLPLPGTALALKHPHCSESRG